MVACPKCGSRRVQRVQSVLSLVVALVTPERRTRCPKCGWVGWKHVREWRLAPRHQDEPVLSLAARRLAKVRLRWAQLGLAAAGLGTLAWIIAHAS
jgi:DNA-directed RNA polymerase subunit RPC12/RpoP